jgi:hypothetical protein
MKPVVPALLTSVSVAAGVALLARVENGDAAGRLTLGEKPTP